MGSRRLVSYTSSMTFTSEVTFDRMISYLYIGSSTPLTVRVPASFAFFVTVGSMTTACALAVLTSPLALREQSFTWNW